MVPAFDAFLAQNAFSSKLTLRLICGQPDRQEGRGTDGHADADKEYLYLAVSPKFPPGRCKQNEYTSYPAVMGIKTNTRIIFGCDRIC